MVGLSGVKKIGKIKFHDFQGLECKLSNSMTFKVFQDLFKPRLGIVSMFEQYCAYLV